MLPRILGTEPPACRFTRDLPDRIQTLPEGLRGPYSGGRQGGGSLDTNSRIYRSFGRATRGMTISFPSAEFKTKKEIGMISETGRLPLFLQDSVWVRRLIAFCLLPSPGITPSPLGLSQAHLLPWMSWGLWGQDQNNTSVLL